MDNSGKIDEWFTEIKKMQRQQQSKSNDIVGSQHQFNDTDELVKKLSVATIEAEVSWFLHTPLITT